MLKPGTCAIKSEYIIKNPVREVALECVSDQDKLKFNNEQQNDNVFQENCNEPQAKVMRLSKKAKKLKGQNKSRNPPFKVNRSEELCQTLVDLLESEERSCTNENCCYMHDRKEYLKNKPADIGEECYNFMTTGRCIRGVACRFGSSHITETGFNKIDEKKYKLFKERPSSCTNFLNGELLRQLRKREYDFSRSVKVVEKDKQKKKPDVNKAKCPTNDDIPMKTSGIVTDEDLIKLRKVEKKKVDWNDKLYLSPLTTLGNLPFRRICKEFGADITCGEMAMCSSLLQGSTQEWALVKRHETEDLFGVQLCGNNPFVFAKCAQLIQDQMDVNFVDINLGCPIEGVYQEGSGSGLLRRSNVLSSVVRCTSEILNVPLTAKIRIGIYSSQRIAHILLPNLKECGTDMVTIHGRSREQRYTKLADWNYIEECAKLVSPFPIYGNGDILSYNDYSFVKDHYKSVTGVMIGRGALIKPWIFTEIKEQRLWDISSSERFSLLKRFVNYGLEHWGSDMKGVENTRRFLLEWLSFLYRYIPVGLLENPPQKINERPPFYRGRDDLETLMASPSCTDWIKISEMLLGPVPKDFHFLPKHKANSYKEYEK